MTFLPPLRSERFAALFGQQLLAQPDRRRRDLDQLVSSMYSSASSSVSMRGGLRRMFLSVPDGAHVGQLLRLAGVDRQVVVAAVLADDLPSYTCVAGRDEQRAALLQVVERVGGRLAGLHARPSRR